MNDDSNFTRTSNIRMVALSQSQGSATGFRGVLLFRSSLGDPWLSRNSHSLIEFPFFFTVCSFYGNLIVHVVYIFFSKLCYYLQKGKTIILDLREAVLTTLFGEVQAFNN